MSINLLKELAAILWCILFFSPFLNIKKLIISFSFSEKQLFQRIGPLTDIANRVVFRNGRDTEKLIGEKLMG